MAGKEEGLDLAALEAELAANIPGFGRITELKKFGTGQSNPTYRLETDRDTYVLRAKPPGELLKSAHQVDREYRVMRALRDTRVPVPVMHYLSGDTSALGRMFFVMEHLDGRIFWDPALPEVTNAERTAIYDAALAKLAAAGLTYACDCSRAEISRVASAPHVGEELVYPGTCRDAPAARPMDPPHHRRRRHRRPRRRRGRASRQASPASRTW